MLNYIISRRKKLIVMSILLPLALFVMFEILWTLSTGNQPEIKERWHHRSNSHQSIMEAINRGFRGLEMDIFIEENHLIIKHDKLEFSSLTLQEVMPLIKHHSIALWLDCKNLSTDTVYALIDNISKLDPNQSFYIESTDLNALKMLDHPKLKPVAWIEPKASFAANFFYAMKQRLAIMLNSIQHVSYDHQRVRSDNLFYYRGLRHFVFTVNDPLRTEFLMGLTPIQVILTDNQCPGPSTCAD